MERQIDLTAVLAPIPGDNPAGEDLRYDRTYDDIREARRADDALDKGAWQTEIKKADWDKVQQLAVDALTNRTKDLQIAAWLAEALINTDGFKGLSTGLEVITGLLRNLWDHVYPVMEEGDMEFRAAPLEFMNEKLWSTIKGIPVTDRSATPGHSWLKWKESRDVGYEADTRNQYGDVDEHKKKSRDDLIAEGKLTAEDFDAGVAASSREFYESLVAHIIACRDEFKRLDETVDERFGSQAPRLSELGGAIEECATLGMNLLKQKGGRAPGSEAGVEKETAGEQPFDGRPGQGETIPSPVYIESDAQLDSLWEESLRTLRSSGITNALGTLLQACYEAPSVREKNRCRLLVAKLCLKAERPDLARPIIEELHALIEELHLDRWESPRWIAEVVDILYQCLTNGQPSDEDRGRARALFERLCRTDVTKAVLYRS